jgi:LmbE family N-acetylglucosaminyl deacetylase
MNFKTALILAPHTDDGEFGCGGTIAKLVSENVRVVYVAFSAAEQSVRKDLPKDILRREVVLATSELGIDKENCIVFDFEVRKFPENRQAILQTMVDLNVKFEPDVVFLPSLNDTHQDHHVIATEGFRAFKRITMLGYEVPWNNLDFRTTCFFDISEKNLNKKCLALEKYVSQSHRDYASSEFVRSLAITRGTQVGKRYAETFEVIRLIL